MTNAEIIAEKLETVLSEAKSLNVNVYILVQGNGQGGIYYTGDKEQIVALIENTLSDLRDNDFEHEGIGSISYGL